MAIVLFACGAFMDPDVNAYVVDCDVDARHGRGTIRFSKDIHDAMVFRDVAHALWYYRRQSTVTPLRDDGRPDKPLTAYTVELQTVTDP